MAPEEPAHLVDVPKTCTLCKLAGMHRFLYYNNSSQLQPRYECFGCGHQFTNGGGAYKKKNRKKFRSARIPSQLKPPSPPNSPPASPASPSPHPASLSPPPADSPSSAASEPLAPSTRPRFSSAADHEQGRARMARAADHSKGPEEVEPAGPSDAQVATEVRVTRAVPSPPPASPSSSASEPAAAPIRPRFPSAADHERARARMARDAAKLPVEVEAPGHSGAEVVTGVRVSRAAGGVVPEPPSKFMYQVRIKVSGEQDVVRCVLMDLESGIPDGY